MSDHRERPQSPARPAGPGQRPDGPGASPSASSPNPGLDSSTDVTSDPLGATASGDTPVHREWAHLRLIEEIGRGGFGRVYRAWDTVLAREVALKLVLVPELDPDSASRVLQEGRMLARVRHPNVVTVHGATQIGQEVGIWMELVRGRSLADVVRADGPRGAEEAAVVALSVCRALAAVHAAGLVHRDVKAHNVMRESGGRIVLMDFGAGSDAALPEAGDWGHAPGTPSYMAPEVIAGGPATRASDIYAVGVLLYFLVTGRYPFEGRTLMEIAVGHGTGRRRLLADDRPDLPDRFIRIVERALAPDPDGRFSSAGALVHELSDMLQVFREGDRIESGPSGGSGAVSVRVTPAVVDSQSGTPSPLPVPVPIATRGPWIRTILVAAAFAVALPWVLGVLTSVAFNNSLGRPASFAGESMLSWWAWGRRALVAPIVYMAIGVAAVLLLRSIIWLSRRLLPPVDRALGAAAAGVRRGLRRLQLEDPANRAQAMLVLQTVATLAIVWQFWPVFEAQYTIITDAEPATTAALHSANQLEVRRIRYGLAVDGLVLAGGAGWLALMRARRRSGLPRLDATCAAGVGLLALGFLAMWVVPYRITWHNEFPRAEYAGERCYILGQRQSDVLLHCPDIAPPRNRIAQADEIKRLDIVESIFTPR